MRKLISKYSGVVIGVAYGLLMRLYVFDGVRGHLGFADLFSVTFIWIVPALIGITPLLFATIDQLRSNLYQCLTPMVTIFLFFAVCYMGRVEDLLCVIIISAPFLLAGMIAGLLFGRIILYLRERKQAMLSFSFLLIPLLAGVIEEQFKMPEGIYEVKNTVVINNSPAAIWPNVVRVKNIGDDEFNKGFFNYAGIPRPLYAQLDKDSVGAKRTGHFEGGLLFKETITEWNLNKKVSFNIQVIPGSIRKTIFDQHILKGKHFRFVGATYQLDQLNANQTLLTLSSTYQLDTRINYYASFWGDMLLANFQQRLLEVIKKRCDR